MDNETIDPRDAEQWRAFTHRVHSLADQHGVWGGEGIRLAIAEDEAEAYRENWARSVVASSGRSWSTHLAKFDGTVVSR